MKALQIIDLHGETMESLKQSRTSSLIKKSQIKISVIMLCVDGYTGSAIAQMMHLQPHTVGKYIHSFNEGGLDQLLGYGKGSGRPGKLTEEEKADCREKLLGSPEAAGIGIGVNWDSRVFQAYIQKAHGKTLSRSNLQKIMKTMGFSYTRPTYVLAKADSSK